jgi:hypothetical protein
MEKLPRVYIAVLNIFVVDTGKEALPYPEAVLLIAEFLEGDVFNVYVFNAGGAFYLNDVPLIFAGRVQDVSPGIDFTGPDPGLKQGSTPLQEFPGLPEIGGEVLIRDINAIGEQSLSQLTNQMPLVKTVLGSGIDCGDFLRLVKQYPQIPGTL